MQIYPTTGKDVQ